MILEHAHDLDAFRTAVREWMAASVPKGWRAKAALVDDKERVAEEREWFIKLADAGLAIPHWPKEYGGADLGLQHQIIVAEEAARADAPSTENYCVSLNHIPATLMQWGTEEQKRRYLPGIAKGDIWCQGFSEPNAGSDLASLGCRAVRDGDHYVVNGQKIWSSYAMYAQYCILLTRTDPDAKKQAGISFFLMDMATPGLEIRQIRQADGDAEFGELFLTDVRIPAENLVGGENQGWSVAQSTLAAERGILTFEVTERQRYRYEAFFKDAVERDAAWLKDDQLRREYVRLYASLQSLRGLIRSVLRGHENHDPSTALQASIVKLISSEQRQKFGDFLLRAAAFEGQLDLQRDPDSPMFEYIHSFALTISGGSNEIMRNIIAERGLGLPR